MSRYKRDQGPVPSISPLQGLLHERLHLGEEVGLESGIVAADVFRSVDHQGSRIDPGEVDFDGDRHPGREGAVEPVGILAVVWIGVVGQNLNARARGDGVRELCGGRGRLERDQAMIQMLMNCLFTRFSSLVDIARQNDCGQTDEAPAARPKPRAGARKV